MTPISSPLPPNEKRLNKAVFIDRDGTINIEKDYLIEPEEFEFIAGVPQALKRLQDAGFLLVVVTNQSGVARGYFGLQEVERLHTHMRRLLAAYGVHIDRIEVCPHHPTAGDGEFTQECDCRKGLPGMLLRAAKELRVDFTRSFMVGDKVADVEAGLAAGCSAYLVQTGYGSLHQKELSGQPAVVLPDLPAVCEHILQAVADGI